MVYVARDRQTDHNVAIKLMPAHPSLRSADVERFARSVVVRSGLKHRGAVPVLDAGMDADDLFMVTELLHGESLRDVFALGDEVSDDRRLDILEGMLSPLAEIHKRGEVHGGLTPSAVFASRLRTGEEVVRLLDTGITPILLEHPYTAPGIKIGSPHHSAPEVLNGETPLRAPADVWAFGAMLYEALTGSLPFDYQHFEALLHNVVHKAHLPAEDVNPDVKEPLARLVDLCLEKDPRRRPPDGRALMRLLKSLRGGLGTLAARTDGDRAMLDTVMDPVGAAPAPPPPEMTVERGLRASPRDPRPHRALLDYYQTHGITDGVWLTSTALDFLGAATRDEIRHHHMYRRAATRFPDRGLDAVLWAALLHPDQDPRIDAVWAELIDAIALAHAQTDDVLMLHRARKLELGRPKSELAKVFARAITAIRPGALPRLYRAKAACAPRHLPATPPASLFGRGFEEPLPSGALAFAVGKHTAYYRPAHRVCTFLDEPEALELTFGAGLVLGLGWKPESEREAEIAAVLDARFAAGRRSALRAVCARLGTGARRVDLGTWRRAVELSCCRAGMVLAADLEGAAWMLRWNRERQRIPVDDAVDDLLAFWSGGEHVRIRHLLGLGVAPK